MGWPWLLALRLFVVSLFSFYLLFEVGVFVDCLLAWVLFV